MNIDVACLVALNVEPTQARVFAAPLAAACARFFIDTPARVAGFVAQCVVESAGFTDLEENLYYTNPDRIQRIFRSRVRDLEHATTLARNPRALANCVYAGKIGNGDEASGDGWRYRGRGIKQITGRGNYHDAEVSLGFPYLAQPEMLSMPEHAALSAAWFWHAKKCNVLADSAQWDAITREVNGPAMMEGVLRRQYSEDGVLALSAEVPA